MNYTLNAKEIMCIAANLGATELYGIPDDFSGISKAALKKEILKVQSTLEQKGYLTENFDGDATLSQSVVDIVDICAHCEKFISVDKQLRRKQQEGFFYYIKGTTAVKTTRMDDEYKLESMDASLIKAELKELSVWGDSRSNDKFNYTIANELLVKAKTLKRRSADEAAQKVLTDAGIDDMTAKIILNGLNADENFYSFTMADLTAENDNVNNVMFINSDEKSLRLLSLVEDDEDVINFTNVTYEDAMKELSAMVDKINIYGEVFE